MYSLKIFPENALYSLYLFLLDSWSNGAQLATICHNLHVPTFCTLLSESQCRMLNILHLDTHT